jgi:uncharacterized membrane protein
MGNVHHDSPRFWRSPGLLIGIGLGGFADGILLHQVLQWHNMLSAISPPSTLEAMQLNMRWDGLFHVLTWMLTLAGVAQLWRAGTRGSLPRSGRHFTGQLVLGWGLFNLIEGLLDHQLLGIHHVREGPTWLAYDLAFLGLGGLGLLLLGLVLSRRPRDRRRAVV